MWVRRRPINKYYYLFPKVFLYGHKLKHENMGSRIIAKREHVWRAVDAARSVLNIYERRYPNDQRPRRAIEAAERWLKDPTESNRIQAAHAAAYAWSAVNFGAPRTPDFGAAAAYYAASAAYYAAGAAGLSSLAFAHDAADDAEAAADKARLYYGSLRLK